MSHLKIIGLCCKRALGKRLYCAKETYNLKEPTNGSHLTCNHTCGMYIMQIYMFIMQICMSHMSHIRCMEQCDINFVRMFA